VIGIWDDHDYGSNNADHTLHTKYVQRQLFLDFIGEPEDTERRLNNERGLYQDYVTYTREGIKVHIILLDVRFHHNEDFMGDRLGEA
jgi:alkaline phosphatase D